MTVLFSRRVREGEHAESREGWRGGHLVGRSVQSLKNRGEGAEERGGETGLQKEELRCWCAD